VVVDLGTATAGLAERAAAREPAVVVLTHDDNDHIGGFDAFIGALGRCRPQFWLPAYWIFLEVAVSAVETSGRYPAPPRIPIRRI